MKIITRVGVIISIFLFPSLLFAVTFTTNLSVGARGNNVRTVEQFLITKGLLTGTTTGYFSTKTKTAVQLFQRQNSLPQTGAWSTLTRKKAETIVASDKQKTSQKTVSPASTSLELSLTTKNTVTSSSVSKDVVLTIVTTNGGYVISSENNITCYDNEQCKKTFPVNKKVTLQATPKEGYSMVGWSEASCGISLNCSITLLMDTTVYARFEVTKKFKPVGHIESLSHPKDTCYMHLGDDHCDLRLTWTNNSGLDMTVKEDEKEYYISNIDNTNSNWQTQDIDPTDLAKAVTEKVDGLIYLHLFQGPHVIALKSHDQILDTVTVDVTCAPEHFWNGAVCWEKGANRLIIFKQQGVIIKSDVPGINCGYRPERCTTGFSSSTKVTLQAVVSDGYVFSGWTGDCAGTGLTCTVLMDKAKSVGVKVK